MSFRPASRLPARVGDVALIGPLDKIRAEAQMWEDPVITTALHPGPPSQFETIAEVLS